MIFNFQYTWNWGNEQDTAPKKMLTLNADSNKSHEFD